MINCGCATGWTKFAPMLSRLVIGLSFLLHGLQKLQGDSAIGFFSQVGIPAPGLLGPLVTWVEILAGLALILGLMTHLASKLLVIVMLVAVFTVHLGSGGFLTASGGPELPLIIIAGLVNILAFGPGMWALDKRFCKNCKA